MQRTSSRHSGSKSSLKPNQSKGSARESPQSRIYNRYHVKRQQQQHMLQQQYQSQLSLMANTPKITPSSYALLANNIQKQLTDRLNSMDSIDIDGLNQLILSFLNKNQMTNQEKDQIEVLSRQLYLLLCKYNLKNEPTAEDTFALFRLLLDPYNQNNKEMVSILLTIQGFTSIQTLRLNFIRDNSVYRDKTLKVEQLLLLFKKIKIKHEMFSKKEQKAAPRPSFTPFLSDKSRQLSAKNVNKYLELNSNNVKTNNPSSHHDLLYSRKLQKSRVTVRIEKDKECTFQPNTSMSNRSTNREQVVDRLYYVPVKSCRNLLQEEEDTQLKNHCTFQPELVASRTPTRSNPKNVQVRNYQKSVGRMTTARSRKQEQKQAYQNLGKVRNKNSNAKPPSMVNKEPKIILQIKIDESRVEKLRIFGNENPRILAKKFVSKNGLNEDMTEVVIDILNQYCSEYISAEVSEVAY